MPNIKMPDGVTVAFPDDMPPEQIQALILKKFPDAAKTATAPPPEAPAGPGMADYASQGASGFNEGLGNLLGFPVDAMTGVMNLGSTGINAALKTEIPQIENPVGGSESIKSLLAPTIAPESDNPGLQMTRRVGQEIGAMAIPAVGPAAKTIAPIKTFAKEMVPALLSGGGAAVAQQVAPGNALAEFSAQILGGFTPNGIRRVIRKPTPKVALEEVQSSKDSAYKAVDDLGVSYKPEAYDSLLTNIAQDAKDFHLSPNRHERVSSVIGDLLQQRGRNMTLTELDQWRQIIRRDVVTPSYSDAKLAADGEFGQKIINRIDELIGNAKTSDFAAGDGKAAANAILLARSLNTRLRKAEKIENAIIKAERRAASSGSGGNIDNAIRQELRKILDSPKEIKGFTQGERRQLENLVRQGKMDNVLRLVGKLSPNGNGLSAWLGLGAAASGFGALPVAGMVAKSLADRGTISKAVKLQDDIASPRGGPRPALTPAQQALLEQERARAAALLTGQVANQSGGGGGGF